MEDQENANLLASTDTFGSIMNQLDVQILSQRRIWTGRSGSFHVEAEFVGLENDHIILRNLSGTNIVVPLDEMALDDLEYIKQTTGAFPNLEKVETGDQTGSVTGHADKPWKCYHCLMPISRKRELQRHKRNHARLTYSKSYTAAEIKKGPQEEGNASVVAEQRYHDETDTPKAMGPRDALLEDWRIIQ